MDLQTLKACKPLVSNVMWSSLEKLIKEYIEAEIQVLLNTQENGSVRETQGKIKAYKNILSLPDRIRAIQN